MRGDVERQGCPVWVKLLMVASLTLNLVVVGLVIGQQLRPPPEIRSDWVLEIVPPELRDQVETIIANDRPKLNALAREQLDLREQLLDYLMASDGDYAEDTIASYLEKHRLLHAESRALKHSQFVRSLSLMDPEDRVRAGEMLGKRFRSRVSNQR